MSLRFHWMLPKGGEVGISSAEEVAQFRTQCYQSTSPAGRSDMEGWTRFARRAEQAGIESVLISCGPWEPDSLLVACALGQVTEKLKFIAAYRAGWMQPTTFVQQVNTVSSLIGGRIAINLVTGSATSEQHIYGDFLDHVQQYARAEEFLKICHSFWAGNGEVDFHGEHYRVERAILHTPFQAPDRKAPEIYISGHSQEAQELACSQATCWLCVADTLEQLRPTVTRMRERGMDVCLRLGLVCRETREEAVRASKALLPPEHVGMMPNPLTSKDDSQTYREATKVAHDAEWLNRCIWPGLVPYYGPDWTSLVGTPDDLARALLEYKKIGVGQFIISGCPAHDEIAIFGREILPRIREAERRREEQ